eukprot:TRINITY_DN54450_c0_g1_i1.p1 TRINITY_DN54450_c0_g1~~TRINITY_DN54450_c0_g1_i1.p1  ORF type:complete len:377 (+),score=111.43 TRINITY_DN54450_c0_g1_i1:110-1240(+)
MSCQGGGAGGLDAARRSGQQLALFALQAAAFVGLGYYLSRRKNLTEQVPAKPKKAKRTSERVPRMVGPENAKNQEELLTLRKTRLEEKAAQRVLASETQAPPEHLLKGFDGLAADIPAPRLQRAEAVLQQRTGRFCVVLETTCDARNETAVLRTAEALGIQHVAIIEDKATDKKNAKFAQRIVKGADAWLTITRFASVAACVRQLRSEGYELWATDLAPQAVSLEELQPPLPAKVAVIFGRELDGVSPELLEAADRRIYIPMYGFTESFNLSVAAALTLQRLFLLCPEARGDLPRGELTELRRSWYRSLTGAESAEQQAALERWVAKAEQGSLEPLADLRKDVPDAEKVRLPPKVRRKMEQRYAEAQENGNQEAAA